MFSISKADPGLSTEQKVLLWVVTYKIRCFQGKRRKDKSLKTKPRQTIGQCAGEELYSTICAERVILAVTLHIATVNLVRHSLSITSFVLTEVIQKTVISD